jgi:hypothetical protein
MRPLARQAARAVSHPLLLRGLFRSKSSPKAGPETRLWRQEFSIRPRGFPFAYEELSPFPHALVFRKRESGILWLQFPLSNAREPLKRTSGNFRRTEARVCRFSSRVTTEKIGMIGSCCHARQAENYGRAWAAHGLGARGASTSSCGRRRRFEGGRPTSRRYAPC